MENLGNSCYFNTALQCLLHVPVLTNRFILKGYSGDCVFTQEYNKLVDHVWVKKSKDVFSPKVILAEFQTLYPQFQGQQPNDVHEAVLCIIDIFEKSLDKEWIKKHFYGTRKQVIEWPEGLKESEESYAIHTLDLGDEFFKKTVDIENYEDEEGHRWPKAQIHTHVVSKASAFMVNFNLYTQKQLTKLPERLEGYRLNAAAMHMGNHRGGHYATIARHKDDWFIIDDEMKVKADHYHETGPYYFAIYTKSSS